jgi:hypothetical protein
MHSPIIKKNYEAEIIKSRSVLSPVLTFPSLDAVFLSAGFLLQGERDSGRDETENLFCSSVQLSGKEERGGEGKGFTRLGTERHQQFIIILPLKNYTGRATAACQRS